MAKYFVVKSYGRFSRHVGHYKKRRGGFWVFLQPHFPYGRLLACLVNSQFKTENCLKKSDAQVGRVNTFIILHTMEGAFKIRNLYEKNLKFYRFRNF
jgi:hypothetical protein